MNQDKVLLTELNITAEVDSNTIKNEVILNEIKDLIKNEENQVNNKIEEYKDENTESKHQDKERQVKERQEKERQDKERQDKERQELPKPINVKNQMGNEKSIIKTIWNSILSNLKYLTIATIVILIQILFYHVPQINQKILELSPNHSTQLKMLLSFVLIYWAQKELYRIF